MNTTTRSTHQPEVIIEPLAVEVTEVRLLSPLDLEIGQTYICGRARVYREDESEWKVNAETSSHAEGDSLMRDLQAHLGPEADFDSFEASAGDIYITTTDAALVGPIVRIANRHLSNSGDRQESQD